MKGMWKAALAIVVAAACGGDAITEPKAPNAPLQPGVLAIGTDPVTGASIETNKDDYMPGEVVHVVGKGWAPGETVNLHMTEEPNTHADVDTTVVADAAGGFSIHYYDVQPHDLGVTFTLTATGGTSASVAVATFRDGNIQVEIAPAFYPSGNVVRRFSVLVRQVNTTATSCIKITVPYTASFVSVTGSTAGWSGSSASNVVTVTSATALSAISDWVRVEVDATPPAGTNNNDWMTQAWTNTGCSTSPGNNADPVVNIGLTQNWTYTADFRDAGGSVVSETGTAGAPKTYRLRLTNTSGSNGDKGIFAVIALPPCFSSPNGTVTLSTNNSSKPFTASVHGTVIRLTGGELDKNASHYVQVEFTTTPQNGCGTTFSTAMWKSAEHNSSENDTFVGNHPSITLGAVNVATTTEVLASPSPSVFGQSVTFTATVTPASGPAVTGTVNFYEFGAGQSCSSLGGAVALGTDGTAPFELIKSDLSVAAHTISACFVANAGWTNSADDASHTVNKANTSLTPTDAPDPSVFGESVSFGATVTVVVPGTGTPTGDVKFFILSGGGTCAAPGGSTQLGTTQTLSGAGTASVNYATLAVGAHTITMCYMGDANYNAVSNTAGHTVNKANVLVAVTDNPTSSSFGQSVTFTAAVTAVAPGVGTPAGIVTFYEFTGGETCAAPGSVTGSPDDTAPYEFTTSSLIVGNHTITACYAGNGNFNANSGTDTHAVNAIGTTTEVLSSPSPSVFGQSVTFTATVTPTSGGPADGTVNFYEFTGVQTCAAPGAAVALETDASAPFQFTTSALSVAAHTISACFVANAGWTNSNDDVAHTVNKANVLVSVSDSPTSSVFGQSVTFTATVIAVAPGAGTPAGTVNFYELTGGQTCAAPGGLLGSDASSPYELVTSSLSAAAHTITACYGGDANFNSGSGSDTHTVSKADATVAVSDSPTSSVFGQSVTFTATLAPVAPGGGVPAGTVTFYEFTGGQTCAAPGGATGTADGVAPYTFTPTSLSVGAHTITACYGGNANFNGNSGTDAHTVDRANVSVTVTDSPTATQLGQSVTFTAALAAVAPGAGTPTGTVTFYEFGAGQTCAAPGIATGSPDNSSPYQFTTSTLSVGVHTITACYGGDANFNSNEDSDTHTVSAKSTTLSVAPSTQQYSDKTVLTATVSPHTVNSSALTGTVHFYVGTAAVSCGTSAPAGSVGSDAIADADDGVGSYTYIIDKQPSVTPYVVTACFYSSNTDFDDSDDTESLSVTKEDASAYDATVSPSALQLPNTGGTLTFKIRETFGSVATEKNPPQQKPDGLVAAGDINVSTMSATASAKGILNNVTFNLSCGAPTSNDQTGYAEILTVSCTFGAIGTADTYEVDINVSSNHYVGEGVAVIQVTDPNAGFATGGGWYWYDATNHPGERVNFGFMAKATVNNKKTVYQGSLLVIRHKADGTVIKVKSNVFEGYSIRTNGVSCPQVTFSGKANYSVDGSSLGNFPFTGFGEDCGEPGTIDKFGLWHGYSPNVVSTSPTLSGLAASAKTLVGGNVQVPQPSGGKP